MQKRPTKKQIREQINHEVEAFLREGGEVKNMARGETGLVNGSYYDRSLGFEKPKEARTPVSDVLNTIDQRRQEAMEAKRQGKKSSAPRRRGPKKKIIYDDFGEPVRIIWED